MPLAAAIAPTKYLAFSSGTNLGNIPVEVGTLAIQGDDAAVFVLQNDLCSGQALAGEASCSVEVIFAPATTGDFTAEVVVPWLTSFPVPMPRLSLFGAVDQLFATSFE